MTESVEKVEGEPQKHLRKSLQSCVTEAELDSDMGNNTAKMYLVI